MDQIIMRCNDDELKHLEYESLREELNNEKRYLFERPVLLFFGLIALEFLHEGRITLFLPAVIGLVFTYSYSFSISRILNMTRIVAYLQVVHEQRYRGIFVGWESYLDFQRQYLKDSKYSPKGERWKEQRSFANGILGMHLVLLILADFIYYYEAFQNYSYIDAEIIAAIASNVGLLFIAMVWIALKKIRPSDVAKYISAEKQTIRHVVDKIDKIISSSQEPDRKAS